MGKCDIKVNEVQTTENASNNETVLSRGKVLIDALISNLGLSKAQAIGVAASIYGESTGWNPTAKESKTGSCQGKGEGLVQWTSPDRKQYVLNRYFQDEKIALTDCGITQIPFEKQVQYVIEEVIKKPNLHKKLKDSKNAKDALKIWTYDYEIPANKEAMAKKREQYLDISTQAANHGTNK